MDSHGASCGSTAAGPARGAPGRPAAVVDLWGRGGGLRGFIKGGTDLKQSPQAALTENAAVATLRTKFELTMLNSMPVSSSNGVAARMLLDDIFEFWVDTLVVISSKNKS